VYYFVSQLVLGKYIVYLPVNKTARAMAMDDDSQVAVVTLAPLAFEVIGKVRGVLCDSW
jgi:hypothetical protein